MEKGGGPADSGVGDANDETKGKGYLSRRIKEGFTPGGEFREIQSHGVVRLKVTLG